METFPLTKQPNQSYFKMTTYKPQVKSEFEAGYVQSRPRATRARRIYEVGWSNLTLVEYETLRAFFVNNVGTTFTYTDPFSNEVTVRFADDTLPAMSVIGKSGTDYIIDISGLKLEEA